MTEPLTDDQLHGFAKIPEILRRTRPYAASCIQRLIDEVDRLKGRLAFEAEAYAVVNDHKNNLLRSGRKLVSLAKEVAKEYKDAADWKDDRGRLQRMAQDALDEMGAAT